MREFTDAAGRTWRLSLTVETFRRVRGVLGVNLGDLTASRTAGGQSLVNELDNDPVLLCDVLAVAMEPEVKAAGLTAAQFADAFDAATFGPAVRAFWEELADFFRLHRPDLLGLIDLVLNPVVLTSPTSGTESTSSPDSPAA